MGRGFYAKLDQFKLTEADTTAHDRHEYNYQQGRDPGRNQTPEENLVEHVLGARCERAGWVFFPTLTWHRFKTGAVDDTPDLGDFIDVKGVRFDHHELLVPQAKIKRDWAYLLISAEQHPYYWLAGWMWGSSLIERAPLKHSRPAYAMPAHALFSLTALQRIAG